MPRKTDTELFYLINGEWVATDDTATNPQATNYLIICDFGDWSGFRPLADCLSQIPNWQNRPAGFFRIVQR